MQGNDQGKAHRFRCIEPPLVGKENEDTMTHEDAGHYAAKHPPGTRPDPAIAEAVLARVENGHITCSDAHRIARDLGVAPAVVGTAIDLLEKRIARCQLGLFGYAPQRKVLQPADSVTPELAGALNRLAVDGRIGCKECWDTAAAFGMPRMAVAAACDRLGLKIRPCQLGAF
jgi:hypothetical protein